MDDNTQLHVLRWWQSMNLPADALKAKGILPAPSSYKARLKRCDTLDAVLLTDGFRALWLSLEEDIREKNGHQNIDAWAAIAAVLAHVKNDNKVKLAIAAGQKGDGDKSKVSELRFAQLQQAKSPDDFLRRLRRIVQQLKGEVAVVPLARDIQWWFREYQQFRPRKADKRISVQWSMDYYRAASDKKRKP